MLGSKQTLCTLKILLFLLADRIGGDIKLKTSSRYLLGFKCARLMGNPNDALESQKCYFQEKSQAYFTYRILAIVCGKENGPFLKMLWDWMITKAEDLKEFEVPLDGRIIKIHFPNPRVGGDGKLFLNLLGLLAAFCYLCTLTEQQGQDRKRIKKGMPINRSVEDLWNHYLMLMVEYEKTDKSIPFTQYFSTQIRKSLCWQLFVICVH